MGIVRFDLKDPPKLTDEQLAGLDAMTPEEIERNAQEDADNPPMTSWNGWRSRGRSRPSARPVA